MDKRQPDSLDSFDKESFRVEFSKLIPQLVTEMSDLLEKPTPRVTKRNRQEMSDDISRGLDVSIPQLKVLETISWGLEPNRRRLSDFGKATSHLFAPRKVQA